MTATTHTAVSLRAVSKVFADGHVKWLKGDRLANDADLWGHNGL